MKNRWFMARARGFVRIAAGVVCVLVGIIGLMLPFIPGIVLILAGCVLLGVAWVHDLLKKPFTWAIFKQRVRELWKRWRA